MSKMNEKESFRGAKWSQSVKGEIKWMTSGASARDIIFPKFLEFIF